MKLRLEKGSIKFRLSTSEINDLMKEQTFEEKINLGVGNQFIYKIVIERDLTEIVAIFHCSSLELKVPAEKAEKWNNSNQVGIKETITTQNNETIVLILEEDLPPRKFKKK